MAYLAKKLKATPDGDGTLAGSYADSARHQHGQLESASALRRAALSHRRRERQAEGRPSRPFERKTVTTGNLLLSILDMYGINQEKQGDSTGRLVKL